MKTRVDVSHADSRIDPMVWKISAVVVLGPLMTSLDATAVNLSLSTLITELRTPLTQIQWVTTGYLLALTLTLPLSGWLVDHFGIKRVYLGCFTLFTLASLLCGTAQSASALIAFRVLQGMAGGLLAPMAQMTTARVAGRHMARVMGLMSIPVLVGPIFGPVLAGAILQHASWRWIFLINLPIGVLAITLATRILPADDHETRRRTFDLKGLLLLSPGLVLLLHSLESLSSKTASTQVSISELILAVTLLAMFIRHGARLGEAALIDLRLFRRKPFSAAALTQFFANALSFGGQMLMPLYLLQVLGRSRSNAGLLLAPIGLGAVLAYPMMGMLTERFGSRTVSATGACLALVGTLPFVLYGGHGLPLAVLCTALFVRGVGMSSVGIPSIAAAYSDIPGPIIPVATTTLNIAQRIGGPVATTLLAIFLQCSIKTHISDPPKAYIATFWVLIAIHAGCVLAALRLPNSGRSS